MMFLCGQYNRIWHYWAGRYPGSVGVLLSPSYYRRIPLDPWMPFVLDNGAFAAWRDGTDWDVVTWRQMLSAVRLTGLKPLWVAVPDAVADKRATLLKWETFAGEVREIGWPVAFCVQDGMRIQEVPKDADVVFVGGTDGWKFPTLSMWTRSFPRVHCARVNAPEMFEACEREGCESIDGTGWFRDPSRQDKLPAIQRFLEGHRNATPEFTLT